jgi:hypothetical protein
MTKKKKELPEQEPEFPRDKYWSISVGLYPGILFGFRTYEEPTFSTHVFYLPFVDFALEIDN